jgi:hypothetical protein
MPEKTSWDTESGLLDDYDFAVKETWFGTDDEAENADDRIFLFLRGEAYEDGELVDDEHRERYSTGKNWEVVEDGAEVENATGKNRFNQNAGVGRLINTLVQDGAVAKALAKKGEAYEAATFNGLNMHMERKTVSKWTDNDTGEELEWVLALPTSMDLKPAKAKKSKGKKGKGGSGKASKAKGKGSTPSLRSDILEFAAEFEEDEHDDFVDQVLDDDVFARAEEITEDDELHAEVLDADSKLWAKAHK